MIQPLSNNSDTNTLIFLNNDNEISSFTEDKNEIVDKNLSTPILPLIGVLIFGIIYILPFWDLYPIPHSCLSLLITISFLWGTEAIPSYATSYLVPILSVWLGLGYDKINGKRILGNVLASTLSWKFMDPIIFVFLGSMTISLCLSKLKITDRVSLFLFKILSKKPSIILLTLMIFNWLIASFLSNVASTTLTLTFSMPIIRSLDPDDPFIKSLLLGIAWSGNCGGMPTSIASPQNIMALNYIQLSSNQKVSFLKWTTFGIPVSFILLIIEWGLLLYLFVPHRSIIVLDNNNSIFSPWTIKHTYSVIITFLTIFLWTLQDYFSNTLGNIGITSMIPVVCFFGSDILHITDFHSIRWSTLSLMGGGLALAESMKLSGLLDLISKLTNPYLVSFKVWPLLIIILFFLGIITSLMGATSAAAILYPIIGILGENSKNSNHFILLSSLMISGSQLFHISSFPNALVFGVCKHNLGNSNTISDQPFLKGSEFFIFGWPTLFLSILVISSIGYFIVKSISFEL